MFSRHGTIRQAAQQQADTGQWGCPGARQPASAFRSGKMPSPSGAEARRVQAGGVRGWLGSPPATPLPAGPHGGARPAAPHHPHPMTTPITRRVDTARAKAKSRSLAVRDEEGAKEAPCAAGNGAPACRPVASVRSVGARRSRGAHARARAGGCIAFDLGHVWMVGVRGSVSGSF
jgi:hypothetical protein